MDWTEDKLWELRMEITLNSLYVASYTNSFGIDPSKVCDFFDGYMEYLEEIASEEYGQSVTLDQIFSFDNADNLYNWFGCFEYDTLPII